MELLQPAGSLDDRRFEQQRLGLLAKGDFLLVVLLEVKVTQLLVYLDETVEILDMEVVGLPQILDMGLRHDAGLFPAGLQVAEPGKGVVERFVGRNQFLEFLDDGQLGAQVVLFLGFEVGDEFVAAGAVVLEKFLEARFESVDRGHETLLGLARFDERTADGFDLGAANPVECDFQRFDLAADGLDGPLGKQAGEEGQQLLLGLACESLGRRLRFSFALLGGLALDFEPGIAGGQRGVLLRKIDLGQLLRLLSGRVGGSDAFGLDTGTPGPRSLLPGGEGLFGCRKRIG